MQGGRGKDASGDSASKPQNMRPEACIALGRHSGHPSIQFHTIPNHSIPVVVEHNDGGNHGLNVEGGENRVRTGGDDNEKGCIF